MLLCCVLYEIVIRTRAGRALKKSLESVLIDDVYVLEEFIRDKDIFVEKCKVSEEQIA